MKTATLRLCGLAAGCLLAGCYEPVPDYTPVGDGLKVMGICLVVSGVVAALADLIKSEGRRQHPPRRPRKTSEAGDQRKGDQ